MYFMKPYVHYDLDFLKPGEHWRPAKDFWRFDKYEFARMEFELTENDMLDRVFPNGIMVFNDTLGYEKFAHFTKILNYPRLLTVKTIDMVMGEPPVISAQSKDKLIDKIRDAKSSSGFISALKQGLIDYSRYGAMLLRVFKDENGSAKVAAWDPQEWVPVFYDDGTNRIHYNVLGWVIDDKLKVQIHNTEDGSYEERIYEFNENDLLIGNMISSHKYNSTGKKLLFAITNTPTTSNPLGTDDYAAINDLLQKAIERMMAILRVLDEHADPSMTGPYSLLSKTEQGETVFHTSRYYAVGNEEQKPEYLVWEANLDSSFKALNVLLDQIYILSEMGPAFIGASNSMGNVVSGTAMRYKMISPLEKARRIQNDLTEPLREVMSSILKINNIDVEPSDLNIAWKDPLPKDPREIAELSRIESGSSAVKPLLHVIMDNYELDEETAQHYVDEIFETLTKLSKVQEQSKGGTTENADFSIDDKRTGGTSLNDSRRKGSSNDPASNQNKGDDAKNNLK